ncbi:unnamed protein product [Symbiodinium necroappetens]|uniref:C2H2-type domain-containing protein n=1 Tax=Symbiodinium necroappetens TaxID=1628268 RepID=A0A813AKM3_9DINO|nr:unnamed protein product [Symbiodinium necroappetens]
MVPPRYDYVALFKTYARGKPWVFDLGKAAGGDGITGELLRADVVRAARQLLPVIMKSALRAREPVTFRGGGLVLLAKRASSMLTCDNYRSILISSVPAKVYHRCLREQLQPTFQAHRAAFQGGVLPGQGIELISLAAKTFFRMCNASQRRAAIIFFDLRAAFYQVLRQLLVDTNECEVALLRLFHRLALPPAAIQELRDHLCKATELERAEASSHTRALIADLFKGSWFRLSGSSLLTVTSRGTRPGDPTADILFAFTLTAFVRRTAQVLKEAGLCADIPFCTQRHPAIDHQGAVTLDCPSWADDFLGPQTAPDDSLLLQRVRSSVACLSGHATGLGMTVKYGVEKTAVLLPATIHQSSPLLDRNEEGQAGVLFTDPTSTAAQFLPAVAAYRHLGGIITANGDPVPDLHLRTAADSQEHSYTVLLAAAAPPPPLALAQARASLLTKLFLRGPAELLALLFDHWVTHPRSSWLSQLQQDFQCVSLYVPSVKHCVSTSDVVPGILASLSEDRLWWPKQVKQACKIFQADLERWNQLRKLSKPLKPTAKAAVVTPEDCPFVCRLCSASFPLRKHLHAHMAKSHQIYSPARHFAIGPRCEACMRHYGRISQVQQHLKQSSECLLRCLFLFRPLEVDEIHQLEQPDKQNRKAVASGKWQQFRCSGPPQRVPVEFGPRLPTAAERRVPPDPTEQARLSTLGKHYIPSADCQAWITGHVDAKSQEAPRQSACTFWQKRPVSPSRI